MPHSCIFILFLCLPICDGAVSLQVTDLVPGADRARLLPVGRLDRNTAGALLLTNDNAWLHALTHPSKGMAKEYRAVVKGGTTDAVR